MTRRPLAAVLVAVLAPVARGDAPPDPLRLVPKEAGLVLKVDDPRRLADVVAALPAVRDAAALPAAREFLDGTAVRRAAQLLAFAERETKTAWPDLLGKIAGGGVVVAVRYDVEPYPVLLVMQGTDEAAAGRAFELFARVAADEQARQGSPDRVEYTPGRLTSILRVGPGFHAAQRQRVILASNNADTLHAALERLAKTEPAGSVLARPEVAAARAALPADPLAWLWFDFAAARKTKSGADFFAATRKDSLQTVVAGSTVDCLRRSDFVAAGLHRDAHGFRLAVRLPAGRDAFPPEFALHAPPPGAPGSLPLLNPPDTLYSQSFYLDLGRLWTDRAALLNKDGRDGLEKAEKDLSKVLPAAKLSELLTGWGPHHRVVVANAGPLPYKTPPAERLPAFGYVATSRDPAFAKSVEGVARGAGFLLSLQYGLKMHETTADGVKVTAYRFPEDRPLPGDVGNARFNFEPAFAVVDRCIVLASTAELAGKLVAEVRRTAKLAGSADVWRGRAMFAPAADALLAYPDAAVTDAVLRRGVGLDEARKEVGGLAAFLRTLGAVRVELDETATQYKLNVAWDVKP